MEDLQYPEAQSVYYIQLNREAGYHIRINKEAGDYKQLSKETVLANLGEAISRVKYSGWCRFGTGLNLVPNIQGINL